MWSKSQQKQIPNYFKIFTKFILPQPIFIAKIKIFKVMKLTHEMQK